MFDKIKNCPKCKGKVRTYTNRDNLFYISYCLSCDWMDDRQMFDTGKGIEVCDMKTAIKADYVRMCPFTNKYSPKWMIEEHGMSIEHWHKVNKNSLTN